MEPAKPPISARLRAIRTRVTVGVVALFAAAWLAVAAFGKGGTSTKSAAATTTQATSSDRSSEPSTGGFDDGSGQSSGPVTSSQS